MNEMFTSPVIVLSVVYVFLIIGTVYFLHIGTMVADKVAGVIYTEVPVRALLVQQHRANRTAAWLFGLSFLVAMLIAGTMEFSL